MSLDLKGKHVLACGSSQGIGRACATAFAQCGATVTLVARNEQRLSEAAQSLPSGPGQEHRFLIADFTEPETLKRKVSDVLARGTRYEILLNNTGGPSHGPIFDADPEEFLKGMKMHIQCNQILVQALVPGMKQSGYGRIINIISTSVREPIEGLGVSNTVRGAVASWAKTLSRELGPFGITVNNILPGYTETPRLRALITASAESRGVTEREMEQRMIASVPAGRFAGPAEIAAAAAFLASPEAAYINGVNLPVDGGRTRAI